MRTKEVIDYCHVQPEHEAIHARLTNWARWVSVRPIGCTTHPMWRKALTPRQWDVSPHTPLPVDTLDAVAVEKAVSALPVKQRAALRWSYVLCRDPIGMARKLAVSKQGLQELVTDGRALLMTMDVRVVTQHKKIVARSQNLRHNSCN